MIKPALFCLSASLLAAPAPDPLVFGGVAVTLILVAAAASFLPALRATGADPLSALKSE